MHEVIRKEHLNNEMCLLEIRAEDVARAARAGQSSSCAWTNRANVSPLRFMTGIQARVR